MARRPKKSCLTSAEFQRRVRALGSASSCLPAARAVLVEGASVNGAARAGEVDVGQLHRLITRLRALKLCPRCGQPLGA